MYEYTDKVIKDLNRTYLRLFSKLKLLDFDSLNVVSAVADVYKKVESLAKKRYYNIALHAYVNAIMLAISAEYETEPVTLDEVPLTEDWVLDLIEEDDSVTLYIFGNEIERKKQRLIEALAVASNRNHEIDKALKQWVLQSSQYADKVTDAATLKAYKDCGVTHIKWVTERDNRVCKTCDELDGKVFPIDKAPPKQHYRCRCVLFPEDQTGKG